MTRPSDEGRCDICGEPMPEGESMFRMHGYSGPCPKLPLPQPKVDTIESLRAERDALRAERDKWNQAYQSMLDPIVRAKMLEPAPPMVAPIGMAEQVLLRERDKLRADLAAARALLNEAQGFIVPDTAWDYTTDAGGYLYDRIDAALDKP